MKLNSPSRLSDSGDTTLTTRLGVAGRRSAGLIRVLSRGAVREGMPLSSICRSVFPNPAGIRFCCSRYATRSGWSGDEALTTSPCRKRTVCRPRSSMISSTPVRRLRNTIWTMSVRERSSRRPSRLISDSRGEIVAFQNAIQNPIDELRGFRGAVPLGDLDRLVDDHQLRRLRLVQEFVDRHPDDVAVHDRHPREPPILGLGLDHVVDLRGVLHRPAKNADGEFPRIGFGLLQIFKRRTDLVRRVAGDVVLKEHLQRELTRFAAGAHARIIPSPPWAPRAGAAGANAGL